MAKHNISQQLKQRGFRLTPKREFIVNILAELGKPISVPELQSLLMNEKININKTTVYRELYFLRDEGIVSEVQLGKNKKYYEISHNHHHHLICTKCESISDIELDNDLKDTEQKIKKNNKFLVLNHSLEFFGLCRNCQ